MKNLYTQFALVLLVFFGFSAQKMSAQTSLKVYVHKLKTLEISAKDSLKGFDEENSKLEALADGFIGDEFHVFMYKRKRTFIDNKFDLYKNLIQGRGQNPNQNIGGRGNGGGNQIYTLPCVNEGFESTSPGQYTSISGWTISEGQNGTSFGGLYYNTCSVSVMPSGIFTLSPSEFWVRSTPIADGNFPGGVPASPLGGNNVAQLNNSLTASGQITKISQTFPVTPSNALFRYAYAACFNGTGHLCCDQPFLNIRLKDCSGNILACPVVSVIASGPSCTLGTPGFATNGNGYLYRNWTQQSIDLTPYLGTCITIEVAVGDCSGWAHFGYCYFDADCVPMDIVVNGITFPAGTNATTVSACGGINSATITAPPGLAPYNWNGPPGSGITNNPNQTITSTVTGNYTLTMNPVGSCAPIIKIVTLLFAPTPTAGITSSNMCNVFTFSNTGSPAPSVQTFSFAGPAPPPGFTTTATSTVVTFATPGTYTVTQVMTNTAGCTASVQLVIVVPPAPNVAFTINNPVQCFTGNSFSFTAADPTGVHSYSFNPPLNAPPVGNTPNYGPVSFLAPGTYTVYHSVTAGGCTTYTTATVVINPQPTPTVGSNSPVCLNTQILLTASGGTSYAWSGPLGFVSAVQNPTINNATLGMNGPYTVVVTSAVGCTASAVTNVTVYALPSPTISSNSPVCFGSILTLTASGGTNYVWTGPNAFTSTLTSPVINNVSLAANGIYSLMAGSGNCTVVATASITINPLPVPVAGSNSSVCVGQPIIFNANGGTQYAWAGPGGYAAIIQNPTIAVASVTNAGIYTVTVTDANTCVNTTTTNVAINTLPVLTVNNPTACANANIYFSGTGAATYAWTGPLGYSSPAQNPIIPNAQVAMSGQYTLVGTSAVGCTNTAYSNVMVSPNPTAMINSNSPVCFGGTLNLTGSGGGTYLWTGPNSFSTSSQTSTINNVTLPANGNYSLLVVVNTCTSLAISPIIINPLPTPSIFVNSPVCAGQPVTFTASGGVIYAWDGPNNFNPSGPSPMIPQAANINAGTYGLTATDANGCVNSTTASLVVKDLPLVTALGSTICIGWTGSITVTSDAVSFNWSGPGGFSSGQANNTFPNFNANQSGQYTVVVTGSNQCTSLAIANVTNYPQPVPTASNNGPACLNGEVKFMAEGGLVYNWFGPNGFISDIRNPVMSSANSMNYMGTYTVGVIDEKGCQAFTTTNLVLRPLPTAKLTSSADKFCVPFCSDFTAVSSSSLQTLKWSTNDNDISYGTTYRHCFSKVGDYVLKSNFTDMYGCSNSNTMIVNAYPIPVADFHYGPGLPIENDQVEFTDESQGPAISAWTWYFQTDNKLSFSQNVTHVFQDAGAYPVALVISNKWGCKDTIVKPVVIGEGFNIFVPNAFTPDNDGTNDHFQPKGYGIKKYEILVFDRWGEKVFHTQDFLTGWDGTFRGQPCKEDTYIWKIFVQGPDGKKKELAGTVTIVR